MKNLFLAIFLLSAIMQNCAQPRMQKTRSQIIAERTAVVITVASVGVLIYAVYMQGSMVTKILDLGRELKDYWNKAKSGG